ncbi:MAG TPA: hypothetical protein H9830_13215 [Candidatus Agrococcus pullicola]|uniref:Uncharacterized protein n=1 Tax=Candidatus Agrococcus pullicola TaxID=2838429 RepID=A0A9D1YWR0_9MICO|nr:hypothetical protein [Candidatus Agrococcus pullicola]
MTQILSTTPAAAAQLDYLRSVLDRSHSRLLQAAQNMPVMAVDWFGPASDAWRSRADALQGRIEFVQQQAGRAATLAREVES